MTFEEYLADMMLNIPFSRMNKYQQEFARICLDVEFEQNVDQSNECPVIKVVDIAFNRMDLDGERAEYWEGCESAVSNLDAHEELLDDMCELYSNKTAHKFHRYLCNLVATVPFMSMTLHEQYFAEQFMPKYRKEHQSLQIEEETTANLRHEIDTYKTAKDTFCEMHIDGLEQAFWVGVDTCIKDMSRFSLVKSIVDRW